MKTIFIVLYLVFATGIYAIQIPPIVLDAIQNIECQRIKGKCHSYAIRINGTKNVIKSKMIGLEAKTGKIFKKKDGKRIFINGKPVITSAVLVFDSRRDATSAAKRLINNGIVNIDLGAFQINYKWFKRDKIDDYFIDKEARGVASSILSQLVRRYGYSWKTLGRYHSSTHSLNSKYYKKLHKYIYGY